jgi:hypothetical protein
MDVVGHVQGGAGSMPLTVVTMVRSAVALNRTVEFVWMEVSLGPLNSMSIRFIAGIKCCGHFVTVGASDSDACLIRCKR